MPVTRSRSAARSKVQKSDSEEEDHSTASSSSTLNKQSEDGSDLPVSSHVDTMAKKLGELPNTIQDVPDSSDSQLQTSTALILLVLIFLTSAIALGAVYLSFPELEA